MLNEGRDLDEDYQHDTDAGWVGSRIAIGVERRPWQPGAARVLHRDRYALRLGRQTKGDIDVVKAALREVGFDETIADRAADGEWDAELRASHLEGMGPVGSEVGNSR